MTVQNLIKKADKIAVQKPKHYLVGKRVIYIDNSRIINAVKMNDHQAKFWVTINDPSIPKWKKQEPKQYILIGDSKCLGNNDMQGYIDMAENEHIPAILWYGFEVFSVEK